MEIFAGTWYTAIQDETVRYQCERGRTKHRACGGSRGLSEAERALVPR